MGSDNTTTSSDFPFIFEPNDNTRYKIRCELLLYSADTTVGVIPIFEIDGSIAGYTDYSVSIIAPNGKYQNLVTNGGYNTLTWTAATTQSSGHTMTAIIEATLFTGTNPANLTIGFSSETGASVKMKKGSLFSYKTY